MVSESPVTPKGPLASSVRTTRLPFRVFGMKFKDNPSWLTPRDLNFFPLFYLVAVVATLVKSITLFGPLFDFSNSAVNSTAVGFGLIFMLSMSYIPFLTRRISRRVN